MTNIDGQWVYGQKWENFNVVTFYAHIGLLFLAGVYKSCGKFAKFVG